METRLETLDYVLWIAGFIGHVVLLGALLARGGVRTFRVFAARTFYLIIQSIALYMVHRSGSAGQYARAYWLLAGGDYVFQIGIIVELATVLTRSTGGWLKRRFWPFFALAGAGIIGAGVAARAISPPNQTGLNLWSIRADIFMSIVTCGVFLVMALGLNRLRFEWSREAMAIGQGLTAWALVVLAGQVVQLAMGWPSDMVVFDYIREFIYFGTLVFWTATFARHRSDSAHGSESIVVDVAQLRERLLYKRD